MSNRFPKQEKWHPFVSNSLSLFELGQGLQHLFLPGLDDISPVKLKTLFDISQVTDLFGSCFRILLLYMFVQNPTHMVWLVKFAISPNEVELLLLFLNGKL
jgi:hypothetical protein